MLVVQRRLDKEIRRLKETDTAPQQVDQSKEQREAAI